MHVLVMNKVDKAGKSGNEKVNRDMFVQVPRGWSRALKKDSIVYFSPSSDCLRSKADVVQYLISDKTCKCGLECPLYVDNTFNFDASLQSRHFRIGQWDKASHTTKCTQTMKAVVNAFKQEPDAWMQTAVEQNEQTDSVSSKVQLPSFETFTRLPEQKVNETLQGDAKPKKASQSTKRTGCYKRRSSAGAPVQSAVPSIAEKGNEVQECITVQSTNTPILHSYVKTNVAANRTNDVVSTPLYPSVSVAPGAVPRVEEQRLAGLNPNTAALLSFPASHLNASSYLASLSSGTSSLVPNRLPFSHAEEMVRSSLPTAAPPHSFANKSSINCSSFAHKPITSVFAAGASNTNNLVYFSGGPPTMTNHKPSMTWQETPGLSVMSTHASNKNGMGITLGKSKGGLSMKTTGNVRNLVSPTSATRFSPQQKASTTTASSSAVCATSSLATSFAKTHVNQPDIALSSKSVLNAHGQQTSRVNNAKLSEKSESLAQSAVYSAAMMAHADKHKPRTPTAAGSKTAESVNQPFQYCGILLQPTGGMVPQVQVAGAASRSPNLSALNIQGVDPSQFSNLYAVQGIPYGNNVGNSGMFGMTPGTVVPYVLGITQTGSAAKSTAATTSTTKVPSTSPSTPVSSSTTSTGSAAIAAAYSAFVSIAPASGTSPSYSQQLMNLVSSYNNPYWQQLLSHGGGSNALAYQLMQMNQYNALRGLAGQTAAGSTKTASAKYSSSNQHQAKQASTTTTASSLGSSRMSSQTVVPTPHVALVVVNSKDLSSVSTALNKVTSKSTAVSSSSQPTVTAQCPVQKTVKTENTTESEPSVTNTSSSASDCKVSETTTTVTCSSTNDKNVQRTFDVACKQDDPVDVTSTKDGTPCNSERNDSEILSKAEDAKSIPEICHDTVNKEVASDDLKTPILQPNAENTNADDSLRADNISTRTSESDITLAVDKKETTDDANEGSSVVVTNSNCDEDVSVDNVTADRCLTPDTENNISRCVEETDKAPVQLPEDRPMEGNYLGPESNVDSVQSDDSEKNYEDEMETSVNEIVENGEAESTSNDVNSNNDEKKDETPEVYQPVEFTIGDVVWAQARGLPSWPGKIVDERDVGSGRADNGKKWVMWFGDHTFSQVEVEKLKTLSDGLKTLDDKGKKRKYRGKKTRAGLQQAIREALEEVDQRDRLRSRQGPKAKKRRLRL